MLLGTLGARLLGNFLNGRGIYRAGNDNRAIAKSQGQGINRAGEEIVRAAYGNKMSVLIPPYPLRKFEIQKYYQNEPRYNGVYSRDNLPRIKDGAYVKNIDEYSDIGTHWIFLYVNNNNVTYFGSFEVENIPKEIKTFMNTKNIKTNISRIQAYDSIMCPYFCIWFIDFILKGKTWTENLFSPNNLKKNDYIILNYFMSNI